MIDQTELAQVREINAKIPFAHPIEQGEVPRTRIFLALDLAAMDGPVTVAMVNEMHEITHLFQPDSLEPSFGRRLIIGDSATDPGVPLGRIFAGG